MQRYKADRQKQPMGSLRRFLSVDSLADRCHRFLCLGPRHSCGPRAVFIFLTLRFLTLAKDDGDIGSSKADRPADR